MENDRQRSREIENVRRTEERRGSKRPDSQEANLRRRLEKNAGELLELDLGEFLRTLKEATNLTSLSSQRRRRSGFRVAEASQPLLELLVH